MLPNAAHFGVLVEADKMMGISSDRLIWLMVFLGLLLFYAGKEMLVAMGHEFCNEFSLHIVTLNDRC